MARGSRDYGIKVEYTNQKEKNNFEGIEKKLFQVAIEKISSLKFKQILMN